MDAKAKSTEFVELQTASETVCATLVTKINDFLHEIWDGVLTEAMAIDQAWKNHRNLLTLCGNISMASDKDRQGLECFDKTFNQVIKWPAAVVPRRPLFLRP